MEKVLPAGLETSFTSDWEGLLDDQQINQGSLKGFGLFPSWNVKSRNHYWSRPLKKGEIGGSISHWRCWGDALERNERAALFFEDDVELAASFSAKLSQAISVLDFRHDGWDLLYLGRFPKHTSLPNIFTRDTPIGDGLVKPGLSYGAHAYMLSRSGLEKVLSVGFESQIIPIDEFLPALYIIHPRPDVARRYRPILKAYALDPSIAFHLPFEQAGSDVEASDSVDWWE